VRSLLNTATANGACTQRFSGKGIELQEKFLDLYDRIRRHRMLRDSTILYVFENNLGKEHDHLTALIRRTAAINNVKVLYENEQVVGFHTHSHTKLSADDRLRQYVSTDGLRFADTIISVAPDTDASGDAIIEKLVHQIEEMREFVRQLPNGTYRRVVTSIHGQDLKRIRGNKDDLQRALSMLMLVSALFFERKLPVNYNEIERMHLKRQHLRENVGYVAKRVKQTWEHERQMELQESRALYQLANGSENV